MQRCLRLAVSLRRRIDRYSQRLDADQTGDSRRKFSWLLDLEDVHLNIENRLTALVGDAGKRLHTGRSRNDQSGNRCAPYVYVMLLMSCKGIRDLQYSILDLAARHIRTIMPGYTHLQVAQPVSFAHHLMAYFRDA